MKGCKEKVEVCREKTEACSVDAAEETLQDAGMVLYYDENTYIKFGIADNYVIVSEYIDDKYMLC